MQMTSETEEAANIKEVDEIGELIQGKDIRCVAVAVAAAIVTCSIDETEETKENINEIINKKRIAIIDIIDRAIQHMTKRLENETK